MDAGRGASCATIVALAAIVAGTAGTAHAASDGGGMPAWVKQLFVYYANDQIGEAEILGALAYLINNGIIQIEQPAATAPAPSAAAAAERAAAAAPPADC